MTASRSSLHGKANLSFPRMGLILCAFPVLLFLGCGHKQQQGPPMKTPEVLVGMPVEREITDHEEFQGYLDSYETVDVRARVTGYLTKINFKDGDMVKKGQLLFEIDPRAYEAAYDQADGKVRQSEARVKRLEQDLQRARRLHASGTINQEEYDKIVGDHDEAAATLKADKASRLMAQVNLNYTRIIAPINGRISRAVLDVGNLVQADSRSLTTIVNEDPMYAYFDIDQRTYLRIQRLIQEGKISSTGSWKVPVRMGLADEQGFSQQGVMDFQDNSIDRATGTLRVRGVFPNPQIGTLPRLLTKGLYVRVWLPIGEAHKALCVPEKALGTNQGQKFLYVVVKDKDGKKIAKERPVKTGSLSRGLRVIEDGLSAGEEVIISGLQRVRPNTEVLTKVLDVAKLEIPEPSAATNKTSGSKFPTHGPVRASSGKAGRKS